MLRGENTQKVYRLGDKVKVQVIRVNMDVRQIDLGLVEILERVREGERGPRRIEGAAENRTPGQEDPARATGAGDAEREAPLALVIRRLVLDAVLEVADGAADALAEARAAGWRRKSR